MPIPSSAVIVRISHRGMVTDVTTSDTLVELLLAAMRITSTTATTAPRTCLELGRKPDAGSGSSAMWSESPMLRMARL